MRRFLAASIAAFALLVSGTGVAFADNVQNDVVAGGNDTITAGGSTTIKYRITANNGDGENGCNATAASPATVTINEPAGVTATPDSLTFSSCGTDKSVVFSSSTVADHEISVSVSDGGAGSYNVNPAKFTLHVDAAPPPSDTTAPVITISTPPDGATYLLNQVVNANYACVDNESTVTQCAGPVADGAAIDTSSVGSQSFTVNASSAGGSDSKTHTYSVVYGFQGFSSPVDNNGVLNKAKAGQAVPLKWRVIDALGNPVTNLSTTAVQVKVAALSCALGTTSDQLEEYASGGSGLQNLGGGYYQFNWKTPSTYANSCKTATLHLGDGDTSHTALFQFTR